MINNRQQSGRRRGRGGQRQNGNPGRNQEMGNRIDNRARGNAAQLLEKYKTLARDAQQGGDRVMAEYYFQFADHYFRVLAETRARFEENNPNRRPQNDFNDSDQGYEGEMAEGDDDEFEPQQQAPQQQRDQQREPRGDRPQRYDRQDSRPQENRQQDGRQQDSRPQDNRPYDGRGRDRDREERSDDGRQDGRELPRSYGSDDDRSAESAPRGEGSPRRGRPGARGGNPNGNGAEPREREEATIDIGLLPPSIVQERAPEPAVANSDEEAPAPRRRGRPRKVVNEAPAE